MSLSPLKSNRPGRGSCRDQTTGASIQFNPASLAAWIRSCQYSCGIRAYGMLPDASQIRRPSSMKLRPSQVKVGMVRSSPVSASLPKPKLQSICQPMCWSGREIRSESASAHLVRFQKCGTSEKRFHVRRACLKLATFSLPSDTLSQDSKHEVLL